MLFSELKRADELLARVECRRGLFRAEEILHELHQFGGQGGFIPRRFVAHFPRSTLWAALAGLFSAGGFFYVVSDLVAEAGSLPFLLTLTPIPVGAVLISWVVTRTYVMRRLKAGI